VVWLYCDLVENYKRDEQHIPENQMKDRVDIANKELRACSRPAYVQKIDSTHLSIDQIIELIAHHSGQ